MHLLISYNCTKKKQQKKLQKTHCKQSSKNPSDAMTHDGAQNTIRRKV